MFALLLVACGVPESGDSAVPDFVVTPLYITRTWPYTTLLDGGDTLADSYAPVYVVNTSPEPLWLEALATTPAGAQYTDTGPDSWLDVSVREDVSVNLAPDQQYELDYLAIGRAWDGDNLDRGIYRFDLVVTTGGVDTVIRAELVLNPDPDA
jgi:hypothetical protein